MANFFTKLLGADAGGLVSAVGDALDKVTTSDQERKELDNELTKAQLQYEQEMRALGIKEQEIYLADTASAREHQSRVQESEHASWLAKNVQPVLAVGILGLTFFLYWRIIFSGSEFFNEGQLREMKDIIIYILGALTTVSTQVASYFFGSSQGSAEKQKTLAKISSRSQDKTE